MCQLNIYAVPSSIEEEKIINILNSAFDSNIAKYCGDDFLIKGLEGYKCYFHAPMACNCGSIISYNQEENLNLDWTNLKKYLINKKVQSMKNIKKLLSSPDYHEKYKYYNNKRLELLNNLHKFSNFQNTPAYNEILEKYKKFFDENNDILSSSNYTLNKYPNTIQKNIDTAIKEAKQTTFVFEDNNLNCIKSAINQILDLCGEIKILPIWQDGAEIEINNIIHAIKLNEKDILYLKYNDVLWIKK